MGHIKLKYVVPVRSKYRNFVLICRC